MHIMLRTTDTTEIIYQLDLYPTHLSKRAIYGPLLPLGIPYGLHNFPSFDSFHLLRIPFRLRTFASFGSSLLSNIPYRLYVPMVFHNIREPELDLYKMRIALHSNRYLITLCFHIHSCQNRNIISLFDRIIILVISKYIITLSFKYHVMRRKANDLSKM